jgi:glycine cleavage system H protein
MVYPTTYRYTKDHEWIDVKGDSGTIGLTDYAQCQMGDIVFVELPAVGAILEAEKPLGTVESVKTVNEIYAPVSGEVIEVNGELKDAPEKVNSDPHGQGWLVKVRLKDSAEIAALMDAPAYEAHLSASGKEDSH